MLRSQETLSVYSLNGLCSMRSILAFQKCLVRPAARLYVETPLLHAFP